MRLRDYINESGLSRIKNHIDNYACGAITAFRGDKTRAENINNNKEILAVLKRLGYGVTKVKGSYIESFGSDDAKEVGESSFFVVNHKVDGDDNGELESILKRLGEKYDQDSILSIRSGEAFLIGTSKRDDAWPSYGVKERVGSGKFGKVSGEFFSRIKGRQFAFEHIEDPQTINGKWGMKIVADRVLKEIGYDEI